MKAPGKPQLSDYVVVDCIHVADRRNKGEDYGFPCGNANHAVICLGQDLILARRERDEANAKLEAIAANFGKFPGLTMNVSESAQSGPPTGGSAGCPKPPDLKPPLMSVQAVDGPIINNLIDGQLGGYLAAKITPAEISALLGRAATELNNPERGTALANSLRAIILPLFQ